MSRLTRESRSAFFLSKPTILCDGLEEIDTLPGYFVESGRLKDYIVIDRIS